MHAAVHSVPACARIGGHKLVCALAVGTMLVHTHAHEYTHVLTQLVRLRKKAVCRFPKTLKRQEQTAALTLEETGEGAGGSWAM